MWWKWRGPNRTALVSCEACAVNSGAVLAFFAYGDARAYREKMEDLRQYFKDLRRREGSAVEG